MGDIQYIKTNGQEKVVLRRRVGRKRIPLVTIDVKGMTQEEMAQAIQAELDRLRGKA